ncbi:MAG: hypothetical protein L0Y56_16795 [Nitrospira sp.]|nr:hypothetical protein [Nitrospira sp.]
MMDSDPLSVVSARLDELGGVLVGKRQTAIAGIPVLPTKEHMLPPATRNDATVQVSSVSSSPRRYELISA